MPTGVYKRTFYHRKAISDAHKKSGFRPPILFGDKASNWKGGRIFRGIYIYIRVGRKYIAEHRLVMEKLLGRQLTKDEVVHHRDHNSTNNTIENLELFNSRGEHTKIAHPEVAIKNSFLLKGKRLSPQTEFKKGQIPWNKKNRLI